MSCSEPSAIYAIIPAAGTSRRMGQAKLLLPWPTESNPAGKLIDKVLSAWCSSRVHDVVVVVRQDDELLAQACSAWRVTLVQPATAPPDMKESIQVGLSYLTKAYQPTPADRCFVAPADLPSLSVSVINRLVDTPSDEDKIVVPNFEGKVGHPVLLPWEITREIFSLTDDQGVNCIVDRHPKQEVEFPASMYSSDVDTPEEYRLARNNISPIQ